MIDPEINTRSLLRRNLIRVHVELEPDAGHDLVFDTVLAEKIDESHAVIRNIPAYAKGLSCGDEIEVARLSGHYVCKGVTKRGGHSTYRIFAFHGLHNPEVEELLFGLSFMGCDIEGANKHLAAVDVPPEVDIRNVYAALGRAEAAGIIAYEEGHRGHPSPY